MAPAELVRVAEFAKQVREIVDFWLGPILQHIEYDASNGKQRGHDSQADQSARIGTKQLSVWRIAAELRWDLGNYQKLHELTERCWHQNTSTTIKE